MGEDKRQKAGFHRYVWLAYEQKEEIHPPAIVEFVDRRNWNLAQWLQDFQLAGPVAGNFFVVCLFSLRGGSCFEARNDTDRENSVGGVSFRLAPLATLVATAVTFL